MFPYVGTLVAVICSHHISLVPSAPRVCWNNAPEVGSAGAQRAGLYILRRHNIEGKDLVHLQDRGVSVSFALWIETYTGYLYLQTFLLPAHAPRQVEAP